MKAVRSVLDFLSSGGVEYLFGIPAGSVNALYDELYELTNITPIVTKHEGAAAYMAGAYAKYSGRLGVCIGCSGPGSTNLISGAANAMREHLPVLFLTGAVPVRTMGWNASQELFSEPIFAPVTKYSVTVQRSEDLLNEVLKAVTIALSGVPGPVHVSMPIDVQLNQVPEMKIPPFPIIAPLEPDSNLVAHAVDQMRERGDGILFVGQGARGAVAEVIELAEILQWPIVTTPQAKGLLPESHPLHHGIYGFAGHEQATRLVQDGSAAALVVIGSSLGETATSNWDARIKGDRYLVQIDLDETVFNRVYAVDAPIHGDAKTSLQRMIDALKAKGLTRNELAIPPGQPVQLPEGAEFNTANVFHRLQQILSKSTRYTVDIGEFMSYVIHRMQVFSFGSFDINVHFGAMGSAIGTAIGLQYADSSRPIVCITGDGCFFMHGMEILTAKEYQLPILFVVMNNARLGMVYHGHALQYKRTHPRFEQEQVSIADMVQSLGIPSLRVESLDEITEEALNSLQSKGPALLEVALVDNTIPPMGDRVKILSSFGK